ncbi:hypothetical protein LUZ61_000334 [Rhynchospora tenuis]|uniref:Uncharacterized protein n=1 Tax=Rhynchospora tenuis TaxID=198213 RepID=A0AAD5ZF96_9POAL|nr:hypothetical protein LUZ61_000334 [Rhynchospora tenuis]
MRMERSQPSVVVAIECVASSSKAEEWGGGGEVLQTGDVVEEIKIGSSPPVKSPFKGGKGGLMKMLHSSFKKGDTSIHVKVRRERDECAELQACIVPHEAGGKRQYVLRSIHDPNYAVGFVDKMESECIELQGTRSSRVVCALSKAQLQDGYVAYPWEKKMREGLSIPNSSVFLSMLILPKALDRSASRYHSLEDTLARANAWLECSQMSGVPIQFMNVQTEALLTKISGETASATVNSGSLSDLSNLSNASLYGFEDYHGVDIGVVKAVRLWYTAAAGEMPIEIQLKEDDTKLGFAISRTDEGFIYVQSVIDDDQDKEVPSTRSGLRDIYKEARAASKLLVISRVANQKVLPWSVSTSGAIRCFDTVSLSQKLSLHRHARKPILLHVLMWDKPGTNTNVMPRFVPPPHPLTQPLPLPLPEPEMAEGFSFDDTEDEPQGRLERDTAGDISFRFHNFATPNNWV